MAGQHVELVEGPRVEQVLDPLAGQHLALVALALNGPLGAGVDRRLAAFIQTVEAFGHRVIGHGGHRVQNAVVSSESGPVRSGHGPQR